MYGIEYYSQANLINNDQDKHEIFKSQIASSPTSQTSSQTPNTNMNNSQRRKSFTTPIIDTDKLAIRLQSLNKCPDYLIPKSVYTNPTANLNRQTSHVSTLTNQSIKSQSSEVSSSCSSNYYTDDFILLTEFSEIEGPILIYLSF